MFCSFQGEPGYGAGGEYGYGGHGGYEDYGGHAAHVALLLVERAGQRGRLQHDSLRHNMFSTNQPISDFNRCVDLGTPCRRISACLCSAR